MDGVRGSGFQFHGSEALHDGVAEPGDGIYADFKRRFVSDACSVVVGERYRAFFSEGCNLRRCSVDKDDLDVERAQDRDIEEDIRKVGGFDDGTVQRNHKCTSPKLRDILKDGSEVAEIHREVMSDGCRHRW